jgi:hypothetical protein
MRLTPRDPAHRDAIMSLAAGDDGVPQKSVVRVPRCRLASVAEPPSDRVRRRHRHIGRGLSVRRIPRARDYRAVMAKGGEKGRIARIGGLSWSLVELAGGWAETSERLSADERAELADLNRKARTQRTPLTGGERAKYTSLVAKAIGTERIQGLLNRNPPAAIPPSPREPSDLDAAARLERAARLRDAGVITEEDFANLKSRYLEEL